MAVTVANALLASILRRPNASTEGILENHDRYVNDVVEYLHASQRLHNRLQEQIESLRGTLERYNVIPSSVASNNQPEEAMNEWTTGSTTI